MIVLYLINNLLTKNTLLLGLTDWLSKRNDSAQSIFSDIWRSFCLSISDLLYTLFSRLYEIFMIMTQVEILSEPQIKEIYQRVTILLGLIMMFVVIFSLIKLLLSPDKINDKELGIGNLLKKIVVVILLLGFTPTIFSIAHEIEQTIIQKQIISKILLAKEMPEDESFESYGRAVAITTFESFYKNKHPGECDLYDDIAYEFVEFGTMDIASSCLNSTTKEESPIDPDGKQLTVYAIEYDGLASVIVGIVLVWIMISYILAVGIRILQFTFLQVIAPIPIISYTLPSKGKDTMLTRWVKQATLTYLDLFIRVAIIYFIIHITYLIWDFQLGSSVSYIEASSSLGNLIKVILTIALLAFAKRFPQLLQELTGKPSAASIGFGLNNDASRILTGTVAGMALGAAGSTGFARVTSAFTGGVRGGAAGMRQGNFGQNMDRARRSIQESNRRDEWLRMQGQNFFQRMGNRAVMASGGIPRAQREEYLGQLFEQTKAIFDDDDTVKAFKGFHGTAISQGTSAAMTALISSGFAKEDTSTTSPGNNYSILDERGDEIGTVTQWTDGKYYLSKYNKESDSYIRSSEAISIKDFDDFAKRARENKWSNPLNDAQRNAKSRAMRSYRMKNDITFSDFSLKGKQYKSSVMGRGGIPFGASGGPKPW